MQLLSPIPCRLRRLDAGDFGHQHEQADGDQEQQDGRGYGCDRDRHGVPADLVLGGYERLDHTEDQEAYEQGDCAVDD